MKWAIIILIISLTTAENPEKIFHGVIGVSGNNGLLSKKFCATFDADWFTAQGYQGGYYYDLVDPSKGMNGCGNIPPGLQNKSVIIIDTGDCTVAERASRLNAAGINLIAIARIDGILNLTAGEQNNLSAAPIALINAHSYQAITSMSRSTNDVKMTFYYPAVTFDYNVFLIYFICVFCIVVGSYWSLYPKDVKISEFWTMSPQPTIRLTLTSSETEPTEEKGSIWSSLLFGAVVVGFMAGMLLLLYFAYKYFVFVFIALFCIIAATGMYSVFFPVFAELDSFHAKWSVTVWRNVVHFSPLQKLLWMACFCVSVVWFVFRHVYGIWPLQVFMGVCVCLNIIKSVPLPNLKIISIIMAMLFVYDIFFVFITPYFTKDGVSIMERVATGSSGNKGPVLEAPQDYRPLEQIPLSIKVPYFQDTDLKVCSPIYAMIGFGDIVIPGLLTAYAAYFDTLAHPGKRKWYYIIACLSYAIGLVLTYIALIGMKIAQPALLYLVPCCLIGVFGTAIKRGEVRAMWTGRAGIAAMRRFGNEDEGEAVEET